MNMNKLDELNTKTDYFFKLHLLNDAIKMEKLKWILDDCRTNHDKPGCYAFLSEEGAILYIGVGAGRGSTDKYKNCGLGSRVFPRLKSRKLPLKVVFKNEIYSSCKKIATIGLSDDLWYLAYSLEQYLISEINPELNIIAKGRNQNKPQS